MVSLEGEDPHFYRKTMEAATGGFERGEEAKFNNLDVTDMNPILHKNPAVAKKLAVPNRRRWPRLNPDTVPGLKSIELSQGADVEIVDISKGGLLLETETRLRPDFKILLKVKTAEGLLRISGTILRSSIYSLKGVPRYRTAIAFNQPLELMEGTVVSEQESSEDSGESEETGSEDEEDTAGAILTVVASDSSGVCMEESFLLNEL
jgi:hypothetical protein